MKRHDDSMDLYQAKRELFHVNNRGVTATTQFRSFSAVNGGHVCLMRVSRGAVDFFEIGVLDKNHTGEIVFSDANYDDAADVYRAYYDISYDGGKYSGIGANSPEWD